MLSEHYPMPTSLSLPGRKAIALHLAAALGLSVLLGLLWLRDWPLFLRLLFATALLAGLGLTAVKLHRLLITQQAYQLAMFAAHDGFWEWDPQSKRLQVGVRLLEILGYRRNFLHSTHDWLALVHPDDKALYNRAVADHLKGLSEHFYCEYRVRTQAGGYCWIASRGIAVRNADGRATLMAGSVTDITLRKRYEEKIAFLAGHDPLTGLANRQALAEPLDAALKRAAQNRTQVGVLFIDLDRFKDINDALGHRLGDKLLQAVAQRLLHGITSGQILIRQGGDEFIVLMPQLHSEHEAREQATALLDAMEAPFVIEQCQMHVGASLGLSLYPDDAEDAEALLRHADMAMYAAKQAGGGMVRMATRAMQERVAQRAQIESRLRLALQHGQLQLAYQPQFSLDDGRLCACEALLRWQDNGVWISPEQFIPVAEDTGLILPLGEWVLHESLQQLALWRQHAPELRMAINVSARQLWQKGLARQVLEALNQHDLPGSALEIEITESMLLEAESDQISQLHELRTAGVGLALDDFGTGYSSLAYLQRLPFTTLKIDRSFVAQLFNAQGLHQQSGALTQAIIAMARSFKLEVVAEGIETAEQWQYLREQGCDLCQGFYTGRPMNPEQFFQRLSSGEPTRN